MKLFINNEPYLYNATPPTITTLLIELGAKPEHTALLLNNQLIPSKNWNTQQLSENDKIELVVLVAGG